MKQSLPRRLLIASDQGFLRPETSLELAKTHDLVCAASAQNIPGFKSRSVPILEGIPPHWKQSLGKQGQLVFGLGRDWEKALSRCDMVIYATEPRDCWNPNGIKPQTAALLLYEAALRAGVPWFVYLSAGPRLNYRRYDIRETWDGWEYQEHIGDAFEHERGSVARELAAFRSGWEHDSARKRRPFWQIFRLLPAMRLIVLYPEYLTDAGEARCLDIGEELAGVHSHSFTGKEYPGLSHLSTFARGMSQKQALEGVLRCPQRPPGKVTRIWLSDEQIQSKAQLKALEKGDPADADCWDA